LRHIRELLNMDQSLVNKAREFAKEAHKDQKRKYTGEPYFVHCEEVAKIVESVGGTPEMIAAAYLHDVVEDTPVTFRQIQLEFGHKVYCLVACLTDVSKPSDGNRKKRKELDRAHTARAYPDAKTIKLADLISNTRSIVEHDKNFARVYLREKELLLEVLIEGNPDLFKMASDLLIQSKLQLAESENK
jgi:(p)ppGpp synthase/HD superfamily hydrolase